MALMSAGDFAKSLKPPISRQAVYLFTKKGDLILVNKKIDTEHPTTVAWLANRANRPPPAGKTIPRPAATDSDGNEISESDITDIMSRITNAVDIRTLSYNDVHKLQKVEAALKTRVEREQKRGELIDRTLIRTVFGRIHQVESSQLRMLGAKLAPEVSGILGIDDPSLVLMVEQRIESEVMKSLVSIKRIINEFLTEAKSEPLA